MENLKNLIKDIHTTAQEHGWWVKERTFGDVISLIHSELSESLEFQRAKNNLSKVGIDHFHHYYGEIEVDPSFIQGLALNGEVIFGGIPMLSNVPTSICKKPDGILPEIADAVIRIFDYVGKLGMEEEFVAALIEKHEFNKTRPFLHGGKTL